MCDITTDEGNVHTGQNLESPLSFGTHSPSHRGRPSLLSGPPRLLCDEDDRWAGSKRGGTCRRRKRCGCGFSSGYL